MRIGIRASWLIVLLAGPSSAQTPFQSWGTPTYSLFGEDVDAIGDLDGDGISEIAIGVPGAGTANNGLVLVYSPTSSTPRLAVNGASGSDALGSAVSRLGDVDADGKPDFLAAREGKFAGHRAVDCFSGANGTKLYSAVLPDSWSVLGMRLAAFDDIDGDDAPDFVIALPTGQSPFGVLRVCSGLSGATLYTLFPGVVQLGRGLCVLPDLDGDGLRDFAASGEYAAMVFSALNGSVLRSYVSTLSGYGRSVGDAGDLDHDGVGDLAVSEQGLTLSGDGYIGLVHIYSHATGALLRTVEGPCVGGAGLDAEGFGWDVSHLGDVDGDGFDDLAVGSVWRHAAVVLSGADGALLWEVRGSNASSSTFARRTIVKGMGDIDGDGRPDLAVALPEQWFDSGISEVRIYTDGARVAVGTRLGFGDGSGAACPCANLGQSGAGCANSTGWGGTLDAFGSASVASDLLWFRAEDLPSKVTSILVAGTVQSSGGLGTPFGDGLLVVGGTTKRIHPQNACANGVQSWGSGLRSIGLWNAGDTRTFQVWYRDPTGPCGGGFNLTNAVAVTFVP